MALKNIMFDNDETLYRLNPQLRQDLITEFESFISKRIGIPANEVIPLRDTLFRMYGVDSSAYLFEKEYGIAYDEFVANTCMKVDLKRNGIAYDAELRAALQSTGLRMSVLTNNYSEYARRVVRCIGIEDMFEHVMGFRELDFALKPDIRAFLRASAITRYDPRETMFVDDRIDFLIAAKGLGMSTVLVRRDDSGTAKAADYEISGIHEITKVLGIRCER